MIAVTHYPELKQVQGVTLAAVQAGVRYAGRKDLALVSIAEGSSFSAVFTKNRFCAAPVVICKENLRQSLPRNLVINSGNANAGTGSEGLSRANAVCAAVAKKMDVAEQQVLPFSTGVIGEMLPVTTILEAVDELSARLKPDNWNDVAEAILTTDTCSKGISVQFKYKGECVTVTGVAKGSGMIKPNMATMLAFFATDLGVEQALLDSLFKKSADASFNRITVDGDTSTNDAAVLIATGKAQLPLLTEQADHADLLKKFEQALSTAMVYLAKAIVKDGEGATKFVAITVNQGAAISDCEAVAYTVAHSPLVKTALFASDPNWGRILAAVGRAEIESIDVEKVDIFINDVVIVRNGAVADDYTDARGVAAMSETDINIVISLGMGRHEATVWTCDLSYDYVKINADYRT